MTDTSAANGRRVAKNTLMLYIRMFLVMGVSLYTSRVVLQALGVEDFGVYNVVGGFVAMLSFFSSSLSNATQRFLSVNLGKGDLHEARRVFSQSLALYALFCLAIVVAAETVGLWFVKAKLVIPPGRMDAALWTYHTSLAVAILSILQVPYMAAIISRERMSFYAYLGIGEVVVKLAVVFVILFARGVDDLKLYATLMLLVQVFLFLAYYGYCRRKFVECRYRRLWDKTLVRELGSFISLNLFGCFAWTAGVQGTNIVLNLFFGPAANAARAISVQVSAALLRLTDGVMTAVRPQIVKSYAQGEKEYMFMLVERGSKYAYFLLLLFVTPVILNIDFLLRLWLKTPPAYSAPFVVLMILDGMIAMLINPLWFVANATGHIKRSQVYGRCFILVVLPVAYLIYKFQLLSSPSWVFVLLIVSDLCYWAYSLYDIHRQAGLSYGRYVRNAVWPMLSVTLVAVLVGAQGLLLCTSDLSRLFGLGSVSVLAVLVAVWFLGMKPSERSVAAGYLRKRLGR